MRVNFDLMGRQEIEALSNAEKILLVEQIWDSINKESLSLTADQKIELDHRLAKHENGETQYSSWDDVKFRLQNRR